VYHKDIRNNIKNHKISMTFFYTNNANVYSKCTKETIKQFYTADKKIFEK